MTEPDAKRLIEDIERAKERLKETIEPPADDEPGPVDQSKHGFFARLFGKTRN